MRATVAAAVLVAGGGGVLLAAGSGNGASARPAAQGDPDPLRLDGYAGEHSGARDSIAAGEPDPNGSGPVYRPTADFPDGPKRARVHETKGEVSRENVVALAKALKVKGSPALDNDVWRVGGGAGSTGPSLQVKREAPGDWTFSGRGWTVGCDDPAPAKGAPDATTSDQGTSGKGPGSAACAPSDAGTASDDPVTHEEAERAAEPVLEAVGLGDVEPKSMSVGKLRTVTADVRVDGLPTLGWTTSVLVGQDGPVSGHGMLAKLSKGAEYPVVTAAQALQTLENEPGPMTRESLSCLPNQPRGPKASAEPVLPADPERTKPGTEGDDGDRPIAPCLPEPVVQEVRKVEFGLSSRSVNGTSALVPSWLFTVAPRGSDHTRVIAQVAVDPKFIAAPEQPDGPGSPGGPAPDRPSGTPGSPANGTVNIDSYSADGRTVTVRFWGGVCSDYSAKAEESEGQVTVRVTGKEKKPGAVCIMIAKEFTEKVQLDKALGDRKIKDAATGESVPKKD